MDTSSDEDEIEFLYEKKSEEATLEDACPEPSPGPSFQEQPIEIIDLTDEESKEKSDLMQFNVEDLIPVKNEEKLMEDMGESKEKSDLMQLNVEDLIFVKNEEKLMEDMGFELNDFELTDSELASSEGSSKSDGLSKAIIQPDMGVLFPEFSDDMLKKMVENPTSGSIYRQAPNANSLEDLSDTSTTELPSIAGLFERVSETPWNSYLSQSLFANEQIMTKDMSEEEEVCGASERLSNADSSQPAFINEQMMPEDMSEDEISNASDRPGNLNSSQPGFTKERIITEDLSEVAVCSDSEGLLNVNSSQPMMFASHNNKGRLNAFEEGELAELSHLGVRIYEQDSLEQQVTELYKKKLDNTASKDLRSVEEEIRSLKDCLDVIDRRIAVLSINRTRSHVRMLAKYKKEKENKILHLKKSEAKRRSLNLLLGSTQVAASSSQMEQMESEEDRLIRLGEVTPFGTSSHLTIPERYSIPTISMPENTDFDRFLLDEANSRSILKSAKKESIKKAAKNRSIEKDAKTVPKHKAPTSEATRIMFRDVPSKRLSKKRKVQNYLSDSEGSCEDETDVASQFSDDDVYIPEANATDDEEYYQEEYSDEEKPRGKKHTEQQGKKKDKGKLKVKKILDDGNYQSFNDRIKKYNAAELQRKHSLIMESEDGIVDSDDEVTELEAGYKVPNSIWNKLFNFQKTCVRWLWELHQQNCGGIIGDEMGLGKTIQVIAFLAGLKFSNLKTSGDTFRGLGPVLLVCPASVIFQWVAEFHKWWPPFRVAVLHSTGFFVGNTATLINSIINTCGILLTTYGGVINHQDLLLAKEWHYIILDEAHNIRNPNAKATIVVKSFRTCHRLAVTGTPIQNALKELWTLFDFIFPGKLGTLPIFQEQFVVPITKGGYANASQVQVEIAYKCATVLKNAIKPYLIRRTKDDVKMTINLPNKSDQVLLCEMTDYQISLYKEYLKSKEVSRILGQALNNAVFKGIMSLRKICNHPDIFDNGPKIFANTDVSLLKEEEKFGFYERSGKMIVVKALLKEWKKREHRVLLFTQSKKMMYILEMFLKRQGYTYVKMNGDTSISTRQPLITKFNSDKSIFVFLLTTKVGGIGVNLTGADRVIIFDPDWNPSTDAQAKERVWRIGQNKQVTIYRLITLGTIEEKIYHRQIFKQFMTNRVLKNPAQQRFFKSNDLFELFQYNEPGKQGTETSAIFAGTGSEVRPKQNLKRKQSSLETAKVALVNGTVSFSDEKKEAMKQMARKIAMGLAKKDLEVKNGATKQLDHKLSDMEDKVLVNETTSGKSVPNQKNGTESIKDHKEGKTLTKSKKRKGTEVEGVKIDFVVKKKINKHVQKEQEEEDKNNMKEDDYILSRLFKKSGVHTAMKHDTIIDSSTRDHTIVDREAQRAANEAVRKLKESRKFCYRADEGKPTDTGCQIKRQRFGQKKRPLPNSLHTEPNTASKSTKLKHWGQKEGGAWSSSDLLAAIHKRKGTSGTGQYEPLPSPSQARPATKNDLLLLDLRNFIALQDGKATTKEIMAEFKGKVSDKKSPIFRALLKKICNPSNLRSGDRLWELKEEFK